MRNTVLAVALTAVMLFGCGCKQTGAAGSFSREDLRLSVHGTEYRVDVNIEAVIADLGGDYAYAEGMSCDYDGLDKTFAYDVATFYTNPLPEGDLVNEIYTEHPAVSTSKGIAVGSARSDVLSAYGEDCEDLDFLIIYSLPDERASLCFEIEDDAVWAIYLTTQPV